MLITSRIIVEYAHLVYKECDGNYSITKDRFGNTELTVSAAMDSEFRVCIVNQRNLVTEVNTQLYGVLRGEGYDVPHTVTVR